MTIKPHGPSTKQPGGPSKDHHVDPTQITCWGCGKMGHYANDPACSQYGKTEPQHVFAVTASVPEGIDGDGSTSHIVDVPASADASALMATSVLDNSSMLDAQSSIEDAAHDDPAFDGSQYDDSLAEEEYYTDEDDYTQYLMGMHLLE